MLDETSGEQYELGPAWVRVTSNEDYWREMPVTNKGEPLPGKADSVNSEFLVDLFC